MENNENKDNKEKTINRLHLIYGYIISALLIVSIILLWILSSRGVVSQEAFQNQSGQQSFQSGWEQCVRRRGRRAPSAPCRHA